MKKTMNSISIITAFGTIIFTILYQTYQQDIWLTLAITFGTICYHFVMRLVIGLVVNKLVKHPFPYNNRWFSPKPFEKKLYGKLKVKNWKSKMPTYNPDSFSIEKHTLEEIIQNMCISEIVHEAIIVFSFLPLFMAIPFGTFPVFLITSICAACIDAIFVIMQRYNRPRLVKIMKKRYMKFVEIICATLMLFIFIEPISVQADTGPKPSVAVEFEGIEDEIYYVTLLSEVKSTGPWSAGEAYQEWYENEEVWEKFNAYSDTEGFYFLGYYENCSVTEEFIWSYYPPDTFKILVYFPEKDSFLVSDIQERYAFDSYYTTIVKDGLNVTQTSAIVKDGLNVTQTYDYTWEAVSLVCRILITILLELGVAWLFQFRSKRQIQIIILTNVVTQTILNLLLNVICYQQGSQAFVFHYIWLEALVFVIEGSIYAVMLHRFIKPDQKKLHPWLYSFIANVVSFVAGLCIAKIVPGIF